MDPKPHHSESTTQAREADARAKTLENEVDHAQATAKRQKNLETIERVAGALALIGLTIASVVHPWPFSALLLAPLGLWAYRRSRDQANDGEPPP